MVPLQREGSREWAPSPTLIVPWAPQVRGPRGACPGPPSQSDSPYTDRKVTPPPQALNGSGALGPCTGNTHGSVIILSTWRKLRTLFGRSSARSLTALHRICFVPTFSFLTPKFSSLRPYLLHSGGFAPGPGDPYTSGHLPALARLLRGHSLYQAFMLQSKFCSCFVKAISHFMPFSQWGM